MTAFGSQGFVHSQHSHAHTLFIAPSRFVFLPNGTASIENDMTVAFWIWLAPTLQQKNSTTSYVNEQGAWVGFSSLRVVVTCDFVVVVVVVLSVL